MTKADVFGQFGIEKFDFRQSDSIGGIKPEIICVLFGVAREIAYVETFAGQLQREIWLVS